MKKQIYYKEFRTNDELEQFISDFNIQEENIIETIFITKHLIAMWHIY